MVIQRITNSKSIIIGIPVTLDTNNLSTFLWNSLYLSLSFTTSLATSSAFLTKVSTISSSIDFSRFTSLLILFTLSIETSLILNFLTNELTIPLLFSNNLIDAHLNFFLSLDNVSLLDRTACMSFIDSSIVSLYFTRA